MESGQVKETEDRVSRDIIYSEMSEAELRHRNYETETARWYTTILVAILGFILSSKFGEPTSGVAQLLSRNPLGCVTVAQVTFAIVVSTIAGLSCYSIKFYHLQHKAYERYVDTLLELEEVTKRTDILKTLPKLKPRHLLMGTQTLLALVAVALIFLEP